MYSVFTEYDDGPRGLTQIFFGEYGWQEAFFLSSAEMDITCPEKEVFITAG